MKARLAVVGLAAVMVLGGSGGAWAQSVVAATPQELSNSYRLHNQAEAEWKAGNIDRALALAEQALVIMRRGPESIHLGRALGQVANLRAMKGDLKGSSQLLDESYHLMTRLLDPNDRELAVVKATYAHECVRRGDYGLAEELYLGALELVERARGVNHEDVGYYTNVLGIFYEGRGDYARAIQFTERTIDIHRRTSDPTKRGVATLTSNLAGIYLKLGDLTRAE
ncbi:MAG TPA: tetratricopeptide repeat protein, partial [Polyangiaceae bacterium]|nr:tetratricopeptide repeat protein [Polyangiaceae bacterium]